MALVKAYEDRYGHANPSSYWRIVESPRVNVVQMWGSLTLMAWKDAEAFANGKAPIGSKVISIRGEQFADLMTRYQSPTSAADTDLFSLGYEIALADPFFEGATEV